MSPLTTATQHHPGGSSRCNKARKRNKRRTFFHLGNWPQYTFLVPMLRGPSNQGLVEALIWEPPKQGGKRAKLLMKVEAGARLSSATWHLRDCASHSPGCVSVVSSVKWGNNSICIIGTLWGFKKLIPMEHLEYALSNGKLHGSIKLLL